MAKKSISLEDYLGEHGWDEDSVETIDRLYHGSGIEIAIHSFTEWANDDDHDYYDELETDIQNWERLSELDISTRRVGFWHDTIADEIVVGYFKSDSNFHYLKSSASSNTWIRSNAYHPASLEPLEFEDGFKRLMEKIHKQWEDREKEIEELRKIQKELNLKPSAFNKIKL